MANLASAKTRINRNNKRKKINSDRLNAVRTFEKATRKAIAAGDKAAAQEAFVKAESALARAGSKGTIHKKTAARHTSRLSARIKEMQA